MLTAVGLTQASSVIAVVRCSDVASGIVTSALVPLKTSALPNLPALVHVAFVIVPVFPLPDRSADRRARAFVEEYAATRFGFVASVVAVATFE